MPFPLTQKRAAILLFGALAVPSVLHVSTLWQWLGFAWGHDLFSYTLLIPVVSLYLIWSDAPTGEVVRKPAWALGGVLATLAASCWLVGRETLDTAALTLQNQLFWRMASWVLSCWAAVAFVSGIPVFRRFLFPILFLAASIPLSPGMEAALETGLQYGSAETSSFFFLITGMTFFRDGLTFQLPTITLQVAPECSGIHSTVVLFVVSLVAGHFFLRKPWLRFLLTAAVLPLGLLRNGFRVWTLGTLCVYDDPSWIHSPLHHRGGPIFFGLSLIPFACLLWLLVRREKRALAKSGS